MNITFFRIFFQDGAMVFEYASVGLDKPFFYNKTTDNVIGKSFIPRRKPAPERTFVLVDKNTNNVILLAMDKNLEKHISDLFTPAIKINQGCPVWEFVVSA